MYIYISLHICIYVCVCMCVYIYIYIIIMITIIVSFIISVIVMFVIICSIVIYNWTRTDVQRSSCAKSAAPDSLAKSAAPDRLRLKTSVLSADTGITHLCRCLCRSLSLSHSLEICVHSIHDNTRLYFERLSFADSRKVLSCETYRGLYIDIHIYIHVCIYIYIYIYRERDVCMYVYIYVEI